MKSLRAHFLLFFISIGSLTSFNVPLPSLSLATYSWTNGIAATIPMLQNAYLHFNEYYLRYCPLARSRLIAELIQKNMVQDTIPSHVKELIRTIFTTCGIQNPHTIPILATRFTDTPIAVRGGCIVLIDQEKFQKLTSDAQRTVIGHEALHIKNNDVLKTALLLAAMPLLIHGGVALCSNASAALLKKITPQKVSILETIQTLFTHCALTKIVLSDALHMWLLRHEEKAADRDSARLLDNAKHAITFLETIQKEDGLEPDEWDPFLDHPTINERITYLKNLIPVRAHDGGIF